MGKIKKISEKESANSAQRIDVYPVTSTKAVYDTDNKVLDDYIQHLKKTSTFAGIATPTTNPGTPDGPVFYLAGEGTYVNFSGLSVDNGELAVLKWNGSWDKQTVKVGLSPNELNISTLYPTEGKNGSNEYTLETAITKVPLEYRVDGLKVTFVNEEQDIESWEYNGMSWNISNFLEIGSRKVIEIKTKVDLLEDGKADKYIIKNGEYSQYETMSTLGVNKGYINTSGNVASSNNFVYSDFISIKDVGFKLSTGKSKYNNSIFLTLSFYKDKDFSQFCGIIDRLVNNTSYNDEIITSEEIKQLGANYCILCCRVNGEQDNIKIAIEKRESLEEIVQRNGNSIKELTQKTDDIQTEVEGLTVVNSDSEYDNPLFISDTEMQQGYINTLGNFVVSNAHYTTPLIALNKRNFLFSTGNSTWKNIPLRSLAFYSKNEISAENYVGTLDLVNGQKYSDFYVGYEYYKNLGANYVAMSCNQGHQIYYSITFCKQASINDAVKDVIKLMNVSPLYIPNFWNKKWLGLYGNSITELNGEENNTGWASYLKKWLGLEGFFNRGIGGTTLFWNGSGLYFNKVGNSTYSDNGTKKSASSCLCCWGRIKGAFPVGVKDICDAILFMGGMNDILNGNQPMGNYYLFDKKNSTEQSVSKLPNYDEADENVLYLYNSSYYVKNLISKEIERWRFDEDWINDEKYYNGYDYNVMTSVGAYASTLMKLQIWLKNSVIIAANQSFYSNGKIKPYYTSKGYSCYDYAKAFKETAHYLGIPFIDIFGTMGVNGFNTTQFLRDGVHPYGIADKNKRNHNDGIVAMARAFYGGMTSIIPRVDYFPHEGLFVEGYVLDAEGNPIYNESEHEFCKIIFTSGSESYTAYCTRTGFFRITIPLGTYSAVASFTGYNNNTIENIIVQGSKNISVSFTLSKI